MQAPGFIRGVLTNGLAPRDAAETLAALAASACIGLHRPALACIGLHWPASACIGLHRPAPACIGGRPLPPSSPGVVLVWGPKGAVPPVIVLAPGPSHPRRTP